MEEKTHLSIFDDKLITEKESMAEVEKIRDELIDEIYEGMSDEEKGGRSEKRIKHQIDKDIKAGKYKHLIDHQFFFDYFDSSEDEMAEMIKDKCLECPDFDHEAGICLESNADLYVNLVMRDVYFKIFEDECHQEKNIQG